MFSDIRADSNFFKTDLAIITLNNQFELTHQVNPICLPIRRDGIIPFKMNYRTSFTVTGWGNIKSVLNGGNIEHQDHSILQQAKVFLVSYEKCFEIWNGFKDVLKRSKFQSK